MTTSLWNWTYVICSAMGLAVLLLIPILYMDQLPEQIPMHYGADGMPDRYGGKSGLWTLPVIGAVLFVIVSGLGLYTPRLPHDPKKSSKEQHQFQMDLSVHLIGIINVIVTWVFAYIAYQTVQVAMGSATGLGQAFLPIVLGLIFLPVAYICWKIYQVDK